MINNILNKISSSSSGNCYIYNQDLMLDIGVAFIKIKPYIKNIKLLCLTHRHIDHINKKTLKKLFYEKPTIKIICGEWLVQLLIELGINKKNIYVLQLNKKYDLGKYIIELVPAIHDCSNCGYKIIIKENNYKIFHITDTSSLDGIEAKNFNMFSIEANYREEILQKHIEQCEPDDDKLVYLNRVSKTHLSQDEANQFLLDNMGENSVYEYIHQSKYNFEYEDGENEK